MKNGITTISGWISVLTGLLQQLIVLGVVVGILFGDAYFGVIGGIATLMTGIGESGLAGLVALILVATWYKK
tara:strand:- start:222 stop:437 length:216 start_codon:yes stop_codon:yes gene_type:complete